MALRSDFAGGIVPPMQCNGSQSSSQITRSSAPVARRAILGTLAGAAGAAAVSGIAKAGPLAPPSGPVGSTAKPLSELEPRTAVSFANTPGDSGAVYVIAQPGSYYLTANLSVPSGKTGIRIAASRVRLDLRGFRLSGVTGSIAGITDGGAALTDVEIVNGTVASMASLGIGLTTTEHARIADVNVHDNGGVGVFAGPRATLERVFARMNAATAPAQSAGLRVGDQSSVRACAAWGNTGAGIAAGANSLVEDCLAISNTGAGIETFATSSVVRCVGAANTGVGLGGASAFTTCAAGDNSGTGMSSARAAFVGCTSRNNHATNISAGGGSTIHFCTGALSFSAGNTAHGFDLGANSVIADSSAYMNNGQGVRAAQHCSILNCVSRLNSLDGMSVTSGTSLVLENVCSDNSTVGPGASGILIDGPASRIEGNLCAGNTYGIHVVAQENYILRNACSLNQVNYSIFSNCVFGTVVDRTSPGVSGMSGNGTVASTVGTTDPFANIAF